MKKILYVGLDPCYQQRTHQEIIHCPVIQICPRPMTEPSIQSCLKRFELYTHVIITSKTTTEVLEKALPSFGFSIQDLARKTTLVIGQATAHHLGKRGLSPTLIAKQETAEGIVELLKEKNLSNHSTFWPCSAGARSVISDFFRKREWPLTTCTLYDTKPLISARLPPLESFDEILFTSPSTIDAFIELFGPLPLSKSLKAIGPITQAHLEQVVPDSEKYRQFAPDAAKLV